MINELGNRIEQIARIAPTPENESILRDQLQMLYILMDYAEKNISEQEVCFVKSVRHFAGLRLNELENSMLLSTRDFTKIKINLNTFLLKLFKALDKKGKRISYFSSSEKVIVLINEKAIQILFERLMLFCKKRMSVEVKKDKIKIKSDLSLSEIVELRKRKSDLMSVIDKILKIHSAVMYISSYKTESEITILLDGMLCNISDG